MSDRPKVLIVEDEPMVRLVLQHTLEGVGYTVESFEHPSAALDRLESEGFPVVLSDLRLPGFDGLEFLERVRKLHPRSIRILITAYGNTATLASAINRGLLFRFLSKPWTRDDLLAVIQSAADHYALEQTNIRLAEEKTELNRRLELANDELQTLNRELQEQLALQRSQLEVVEQARTRLVEQMERTLDLCYQLQEKNDPALAIHTKARVDLCRRLCVAAPLSEDDKRALITSAWLCDLGLIGIPSRVLEMSRKAPASLDVNDRALIENHPMVSQQLAGLVDSSPVVSSCIRAHHERHDGSGFPDRLSDERIPDLARILSVVVYFTESQSSSEETLRQIEKGSGTLFHPDAVRLLFRFGDVSMAPPLFGEVVFEELKPGMKLANSLYGPTGLLLVAKNRVLDSATIEHIRKYNQRNPLHQRIFIYR